MTSTTSLTRRDNSTPRRRAAVLAATLCTATLALAAAGCGGSNGVRRRAHRLYHVELVRRLESGEALGKAARLFALHALARRAELSRP